MLRVFGRAVVGIAVLLVGCGASHPRHPATTQTAAQLDARAQSATPALACIAKRASGAHTTASPRSLEASWPGRVPPERLSVREMESASQAAYVAAGLKAREANGEEFMVVSVATGRYLVQWGPQAPTVEQGAVLKGCLP
jgi:hypothetical protein